MSKTNPLGPLAAYIGSWEGNKGIDIAPDEDPSEIERNVFRERIVLEPIPWVENHAQKLHGLRYSKIAWRIDADESFHEEMGYWLWDAERTEVLISFSIPRGVTVLAGGIVSPDAEEVAVEARRGSHVFGICSGPFLDAEFRTTRFEMTLRNNAEGSFHYAQTTHLEIPGQPEPFQHTDQNTLFRV